MTSKSKNVVRNLARIIQEAEQQALYKAIQRQEIFHEANEETFQEFKKNTSKN